MPLQQTDYNITFIEGQTHMPTFVTGNELLEPGYDIFVLIEYVIVGVGLGVTGFGISTNVFNIITFLTMGIEDSVTTLFFGMAWSDLIQSILSCICFIVVILKNLEKVHMLWLNISPLAMVMFSDNSALILQVTTALTSTFLAVLRCMCVVRPLHFKNMFTRKRSLIALVLCFLFPLALHTVIFAEMGMTKRFDESKNASRLEIWLSAEREKVKNIVRIILNCVIPISTQIIVFVCVAIMISKLREAALFRNRRVHEDVDKGSHSNNLTGKDRQVAVQVILISIIYMVTNIPKILSSILSIVEPRFQPGKAFENMYGLSHSLQNLFETINASFNFFIYYKFSKSFRSACFLSKTKSS